MRIVTMSRFHRCGVIPSMERELEIELVARLRARDVAAFDQIYNAFNSRLLSFLTRLSKNRSLAEDLTEETWLRLVSGGENLLADTRLVPWLFTVARNLYVGHCRARAREYSHTDDLIFLWPAELPQSPFDLAAMDEFERRLEAAIASLPPFYREAVLLVGVEQLRPSEAAKVCGITAESLRQRLSRARRLISNFLVAREVSPREVSK
jgi:RNA polymerase sigma-70 factor (ECF subfamily)